MFFAAQSILKSCYGRSLHEHLQASKREIALPLEACALCILALGSKEEVRVDVASIMLTINHYLRITMPFSHMVEFFFLR